MNYSTGQRLTESFFLAGALLILVGCSSDQSPRVTGHQGGLLPGMAAPASSSKPADVTMGATGVLDQTLPDGRVLRRELLNGRIASQTWYSSLQRPERQIFYQADGQPVAQVEYGADGQMTRKTTLFPGTSQPQRIEEYAEGTRITRFTVYWSNGNLRTISETGVPMPVGLINRVQQWYENGRPKSLTQKIIARDGSGQPLSEELQGRQTEWDGTGSIASDAEYDHGVMKHNYLADTKKYN